MEAYTMMIGDGDTTDGTLVTTTTTIAIIAAAIAALILPYADMGSVSVTMAMKDGTEDADDGATTGLHIPCGETLIH